MLRKSRLGLLFLLLTIPLAGNATPQQNAPHSAPRFVTTRVKLNENTTVNIRHVDLAHFDIADAATPPPISVSVTILGKTTPETVITGDKNFPPWGFTAAFPRDLDRDGTREVFVCSFCNFGGSGEARYLTVVSLGDGLAAPTAWTLPRGEQENIHSSTFFLARDAEQHPAVVITHPMMDGETRPDPTHWRVSAYRLVRSDKAGTPAIRIVSAGEKKTTSRYSERLPEEVAAKYVPKGWELTTPLY